MLAKYIKSHMANPFKWGSNDCMTFVDGMLLAQGFRGLPANWIGGYSNAWGAARHYARLLKETGHSSIVDAMDDRYARIVTLHPPTGSIVARPVDGDVLGYAFGTVFSGNVVFLTEQGMAHDQVQHCDMFWSAT